VSDDIVKRLRQVGGRELDRVLVREEAADEIERLLEEQQKATLYAESLAVALSRHFPHVPQWRPFTGDLIGLLTQIDNMTTGLLPAHEVERLRAENERLRTVTQTAFGLLWQDRSTEARLHLSAALTKEQKGDGIAAARSMDEVKYKDLPIPPPVAKAVEALEHAAKHYQWLSDDEGDTGWVKYQAAAVMLDHWAAGIGEEKK